MASETLQKIQRYAESDDPKESLIALNVLIAILIMGLLFASWIFSGSEIYSLGFFAILAISLLFSSVVGLGYFRLFETIARFSSDQANGLRLSIILELIILPCALAGLLFQQPLLIRVAFILLPLQMLAPLAGPFIQLSDIEASDQHDDDLIWTGLGRLESLITVGSFLTNVLIIVLRHIG